MTTTITSQTHYLKQRKLSGLMVHGYLILISIDVEDFIFSFSLYFNFD